MLLFLSCLILFPFLTYYISTLLFYRQVNSKASRKTPPTIPYLFAGIFHAFSLAYEGPQKYFATLLKEYGTSAPFVVRAGLQTFVVLRDPGHIEKVMQASKQGVPDAIDLHKYGEVFGSPRSVLDLYAGRGASTSTKQALRHAHVDLPRKYLTGTALANMTDVYATSLSRSLNDKMFQFKFWTQIEDFWSFFQQVITRCTIEAFFGSAILKEHRKLLKDYWAYDEAVAGFMPGMSRLLMTATYEAPRDRMLEGLEKWLKNHHSGSEFARISEEDPAWDEDKGSKFLQERDDVLAKLEGFNVRARAAEMLSIMHSLNTSVVPPSFWSLIEILRDDSLTKRLTPEIAKFHASNSGEYDVTGLTRLPFLQAIQKETQRLHVANCLVRTLDSDCELDVNWQLPKGASAVAFSHDLAMNTPVWTSAVPQSVQQALTQFWPGRFLVPDRTALARQSQQRRHESGRFTMQGLEQIFALFESDQDAALLGEELAHAFRAATLAVFLTEFELQLCEVEVVQGEELPPVPQLAFGRLGFHEKMAVRIRKRAV
ncbi:similar to putative cytochrome P450 [Plenodomus lingam JN3]|uniref:Similar to putative cytochrome P450 n=1 Tax=Leptosphaeria maculans (strain JN3 / isolate v23.1.3 / race Av1-4-5-6-7-8) TaxID=985895 RepID=E5A577_LEPMJ|nr:similar to putative cytochrome P450 [Plenodomus lingam JN3]CBX98775.1 similar to putative cytochrome P450 [Plenodomus lingam JN3]